MMRRAKIIATIGPGSETEETLEQLLRAGMDVARMNFSHGTHEEHAERISLVRKAAKRLGVPVGILQDLQGPKIRVGELPGVVQLVEGELVTLYAEGIPPHSESEGVMIPVDFHQLFDSVQASDRLLLDDGRLTLEVVSVRDQTALTAKVIRGGSLSSHKGINLPGIGLAISGFTEKDEADLEYGLSLGVDAVAVSFVRTAEDIRKARQALERLSGGKRMPMLIAKLEKPEAVDNLDAILDLVDGVMVARGDLGVELPPERVPVLQKHIIRTANARAKLVITATQMLESMVTHPRPTRAEASDVANAILDGTDAVMLSAETAAGKYPRLAVEAMTRIISEIEKHPPAQRRDERQPRASNVSTEFAIAAASSAAVRMLGAPLLIVFTKSGFSARIVASHRPNVPILVLTDIPRTYRQLALIWGVMPELVPHCETYDEMVRLALEVVRSRGLARSGDKVVVTAGVPFDVPGSTNTLKVETV
jgi:pyruvate kinase